MAEVLVVEDNPVNSRLVESILQQAGYQVDIAEHGQRALTMLERGGYRLVLMDLNMPVMDGFQTIVAIREHVVFGHIPVIAVTVDTSDGIMTRVREVGFSDYIAKPYSRKELIESVRFHLGEMPD